MDAEIRLKIDIARLVERADKVAGLGDGGGKASAVARVDAQIAVAQLVGGEKWRAAGQVENKVAVRDCPVARRAEA
jgi:hypothetical protein